MGHASPTDSASCQVLALLLGSDLAGRLSQEELCSPCQDNSIPEAASSKGWHGLAASL